MENTTHEIQPLKKSFVKIEYPKTKTIEVVL